MIFSVPMPAQCVNCILDHAITPNLLPANQPKRYLRWAGVR